MVIDWLSSWLSSSFKLSNHHNSFDSRTRNNCSNTSNSSSSSNPTRSSWSCLMLLEGHAKKTGPLQSLSFELWSFVFCARWCLALSGSTWDHTNGQTWNQHWLIDSSRILLPRSFQCWIFCQSFQQYEKTLKQSEHSWTALSTDCYSKDLESIKHARTCRVNWFLLSSTKGCRALLFCQWSFLLSWVTAWCEQWGPCLELVAAGLKIWGLIDGFSNWFNDKVGGQLCQARAVGASESNRSTMLKGMSFSSLWRISW